MPVDVECDLCGDSTEKLPAEIENSENNYCSTECSTRAQQNDPEKSNAAKCDFCGDEFRRQPSNIGRYESGNAFCSRECFENHRLEQTNLVELSCDACGEPYEVPESRVAHVHYCSEECEEEHSEVCPECGKDGFKSLHGVKLHFTRVHDEPYDKVRLEEEYGVPLDELLHTMHWDYGMTVLDMSEELDVSRDWINERLEEYGSGYRKITPQSVNKESVLTPEDVPFTWFGIRAVRKSFHGGWANLSRSVRLEERQCELCGVEEEYDELTAHHIVPLRFGGVNERWNLMVLCGDCHSTVETFSEEILEDVHD